MPATGNRRERVTATTIAIATAFERVIEDAPEQWWAVFFPIWPDLESDAGEPRAKPRASRRATPPRRARRGATGHDRPTDPGRADLHIHTIASDGTADVVSILDHVARLGDLDVIAITDHERIDAAVAGRTLAEDRGLPFEVVIGEEVTTLGGHLVALFIERPIRPYRSLRTTIADVHDAGGLAIPAHPLVPYPLCAQGWVLRRLLDDPDPAVHPDALETFNPTALGRPWHDRVVRFAQRHGLPGIGNSDAHALDAIGTRLDDLRRPDRGRPPRRDQRGHDDPRWVVPRHGRAGGRLRSATPQEGARRPRRGGGSGPP